uniref:Uncharacterized protein n=1 Tax=Arundo donax TaxID=35708 RepID=A0A0A8YKP4_ARUDO
MNFIAEEAVLAVAGVPGRMRASFRIR